MQQVRDTRQYIHITALHDREGRWLPIVLHNLQNLHVLYKNAQVGSICDVWNLQRLSSLEKMFTGTRLFIGEDPFSQCPKAFRQWCGELVSFSFDHDNKKGGKHMTKRTKHKRTGRMYVHDWEIAALWVAKVHKNGIWWCCCCCKIYLKPLLETWSRLSRLLKKFLKRDKHSCGNLRTATKSKLCPDLFWFSCLQLFKPYRLIPQGLHSFPQP